MHLGHPLGAVRVMQPTGRGVAGAQREPRRRRRLAHLHGMGAAGEIRAARRRREQIRRRAVDGGEGLLGVFAVGGHGGAQAQRVGMRGAVEHVVGAAGLQDFAGVHHGHLVRHAGDDAQIVRDEHDGHVVLALQVTHEVEDLRLDRHVEGRGGFIGDEDGGFAGQGHGDHGALQHAAGELERILPGALVRLVDARHGQQLRGPRPRLAAAHAAVYLQRLRDLIAHPHGGVQGGHRVLEDHAHLGAAHVLAVDHRAFEEIVPVEARRAAGDAARRHGDEAHHALHRDGLAAAGFADDGERLAGMHVERHPPHRLHGAAVGGELHLKVAHFEECPGVAGVRPGFGDRRSLTHRRAPASSRPARPAGRRRAG